MRLSELKAKQQARISQVHHTENTAQSKDDIATRLTRLGFVPGEQVEVITRGLFGGDPILVKIGFSRFALRCKEAQRIELDLQ